MTSSAKSASIETNKFNFYLYSLLKFANFILPTSSAMLFMPSHSTVLYMLLFFESPFFVISPIDLSFNTQATSGLSVPPMTFLLAYLCPRL